MRTRQGKACYNDEYSMLMSRSVSNRRHGLRTRGIKGKGNTRKVTDDGDFWAVKKRDLREEPLTS